MEDRIPRWLQHRHETCCEKGDHRKRWACMIRRWFHHGNVISRWVNLHMIHIVSNGARLIYTRSSMLTKRRISTFADILSRVELR